MLEYFDPGVTDSPFQHWLPDDESFVEFEGETRKGRYKRKLNEGVANLWPSATSTGFGSPTATGHYYKKDWRRVNDEEFSSRFTPRRPYRMLSLNRQRSPTRAIKRILDKPQCWTLDCAYFVQVAQLYALSQTDPKGFDRMYRGKPFYLRYHDSTGTKRHYYFDKERIGDNWRAWFRKSQGAPITLNKINPAKWTDQRVKAEMPIGSRLMWRNNLIKLSDNEAFRNENAVKVGTNQYRTFGFNIRRSMTEDEIKMELAGIGTRRGYPDPHDTGLSIRDYANKHVFLSEAQSFKGP